MKVEFNYKSPIGVLFGTGLGVLIARRSKLSRLPTLALGLSGATASALVCSIKEQTNVNAKDDHKQTPLHKAARMGHKDDIVTLIKMEADVNAKDDHKQTPLHKAATMGHKDVILTLIEMKANVNAKDKFGDTPLHLAASRGHEDVIVTLIKMGADVNAKDENKRTPHKIAALFQKSSAFKTAWIKSQSHGGAF